MGEPLLLIVSQAADVVPAQVVRHLRRLAQPCGRPELRLRFGLGDAELGRHSVDVLATATELLHHLVGDTGDLERFVLPADAVAEVAEVRREAGVECGLVKRRIMLHLPELAGLPLLLDRVERGVENEHVVVQIWIRAVRRRG